jgi:regulator of RNase E activity RraB
MPRWRAAVRIPGMRSPYPDDADGDALQRVADGGSDMSKPMSIEFALVTSDMAKARAIAEVASAQGYRTDINIDDETGGVAVYCARTMLATYEGVVSGQAELTRLCEPFGVVCESWGTYGNRPDH